jgi:hypothetical protein
LDPAQRAPTSCSRCASCSITPSTVISLTATTSPVGVSKRKSRVDRHDFEIISNDQYERLRKCARSSRVDDYGLKIEGTLLAVGDAVIRSGEIFALHRDEVDFTENVIHLCWQLDSVTQKREFRPRHRTAANSLPGPVRPYSALFVLLRSCSPVYGLVMGAPTPGPIRDRSIRRNVRVLARVALDPMERRLFGV